MLKFCKIAILFLLFLLVACGGDVKETFSGKGGVENLNVPEKPNRIIYLNCNKEFNDLNDTHTQAALQIGIVPLQSREGIKDASRELYLVGDAMRFFEPFVVDKLEHSSPFLVKEAVSLLWDIGQNFQDSLKNKHLPAHSIIVTSVLRTDDDVTILSKSNINASERSVHCYGTTVDITYTRFQKHDDEAPDADELKLKAVLAEVLRDLRDSGRCYVKYEVKQSCFHITARK
jgi:hypothetical protein